MKNKKYVTVEGNYPVEVLKDDLIGNPYTIVIVITLPNGNQLVENLTADFKLYEESEGAIIREVSPYEDFKIDEPVLVWGDKIGFEDAKRRHFAGVTVKGSVKVFASGGTSGTNSGIGYWEHCRRPTEDELYIGAGGSYYKKSNSVYVRSTMLEILGGGRKMTKPTTDYSQKFDIMSYATGEVKFTADITCPKGISTVHKKRLALLWAIENDLNLSDADLSYADLSYANLNHTNLSYANLNHANLNHTNLSYANLNHTNLSYANLNHTNLSYANLNHTNLSNATLRHVDLYHAIGNSREVKSVMVCRYHIAWTKSHMAIGCQQHTIETWFNFSDEDISKMDDSALEWWGEWKLIIKLLIEKGGD